MGNITFTMVKPDATGKSYTGAILDRILKAGFAIRAMKWTKLTKEQAGAFYAARAVPSGAQSPPVDPLRASPFPSFERSVGRC